MSSVSGRVATPYLGPYSASKHALEALSDALRTELRNWAIHVALVEPGSTATPIWEKSIAAGEALRESSSPEAVALYQADLDAAVQAVRRIADAAIPVENVVRAVVHAITSPRPRFRYPVGRDTRISLWLSRLLPTRLWDRMLRQALGLR
jgi:short-subunit dehydrogenase